MERDGAAELPPRLQEPQEADGETHSLAQDGLGLTRAATSSRSTQDLPERGYAALNLPALLEKTRRAFSSLQ